MSKSERVIAVTGVLVVAVGVLSSVSQQKKWPSARFWIGVGLMYVLISALGEWEPEVAEPLSIAVLTTVLLGESTVGVLSFIQSRQNELNTTAPVAKAPPTAAKPTPAPPHPGKPLIPTPQL